MKRKLSISAPAVRTVLLILLLLPLLPAAAQYAGSTAGIVQDMSSTSSYIDRRSSDRADTAAFRDYRAASEWTPIRNGYQITEAEASRPEGIGLGRRPLQSGQQATSLPDMRVPYTITSSPRVYSGILGDLLRREPVSLTPLAMSHALMVAEPGMAESLLTDSHPGGPRRVNPNDNPGDPGAKPATPVGDIPWGLVVLIMSFELGIRNRRRRLREESR